MLHVVNKSPFEKNSLDTCIRLSKSGSDILLIEDGVYGALFNSEIAGDMTACLNDRNVYVLGPDLQARGISESQLVSGISVIDYGGFVRLAAAQPKVQSWL